MHFWGKSCQSKLLIGKSWNKLRKKMIFWPSFVGLHWPRKAICHSSFLFPDVQGRPLKASVGQVQIDGYDGSWSEVDTKMFLKCLFICCCESDTTSDRLLCLCREIGNVLTLHWRSLPTASNPSSLNGPEASFRR